MRLKSELYKKEQEIIVDKIIKILDLENNNKYTLYQLDNNFDIKNKILELNKIIEVKSDFTITLNPNIIILKKDACIASGYFYEIWVYNSKGQRYLKTFE
jgi:hypothetical protein